MGARGTVSVLIVDDHEMMTDGLRAVIEAEDGLEVAGTASDGAQALEAADAGAFDVAVVDFRLPDMDGGDVTSGLKQRLPNLRVVLMTASDGYAVVTRAIGAGAEGFVHKTSPVTDIVAAIRSVAAGDSWFPAEALERLSAATPAPSSGVGSDLTKREREILQLLATGATTSSLAESLYVSTHTVRNHVRNILAKLHAHSKLEAVAVAARAGLVSVGAPDDVRASCRPSQAGGFRSDCDRLRSPPARRASTGTGV